MSNAATSSAPARARTRLHVDADLASSRVRLDADQTHYLRNVMRIPAGGLVLLFNARDGEWLARIDLYAKNHAEAEPVERRRAPARESDLWLVFAPIKRAHLDYVVEKATELGVSALRPVMTRRTVAERVNLDRMRATATEAAEQSERLSVPEILPPVTLPQALANWPAERNLLLCDETGGGGAIAEVLARADLAAPWAVLTGPEGGFAPEELEMLRAHAKIVPAGLGPRVLRADTAAIAALAVFQSLAPGADRPPRFAGP